MEVQKGEEQEPKTIFGKMVNFPHLVKEIDIQVQEVESYTRYT